MRILLTLLLLPCMELFTPACSLLMVTISLDRPVSQSPEVINYLTTYPNARVGKHFRHFNKIVLANLKHSLL